MKAAIARMVNEDHFGKERSSTIFNGVVLFLIALSFFQTMLEADTKYQDFKQVFAIVDTLVILLFTAEFALRFWVADVVDPAYKGAKGKLYYFLNFYTIIDFAVIAPFFFSLLTGGIGGNLYKIMRVLRIVRIVRFFKSFNFILQAVRNKKSELLISLGMVLILLVIASTIMFQLEHASQPDKFTSIPATMWWGVATLTTVGYGDVYPITGEGKVLGGIMAILGVGLFALPAGIIASGFVDEIEKAKKLEHLKDIEEKLKHAFFVEYFVPVMNIKKALGLQDLPRKWLSMNDIKYKIGIKEADILDVVAFSPLFRLRNVKLSGVDKAGLEFIDSNQSYGRKINRQSKLTILDPYASIQPYFGHMTMGIANILGANYISNENFSKLSFVKDKQLNLTIHPDFENPSADSHPALLEWREDIKEFLKPGSRCIFFVNAANNERLIDINTGGVVGEAELSSGKFYKNLEELEAVRKRLSDFAATKELEIRVHDRQGAQGEHHLSWYIHREFDCELVLLHLNVGILKKKSSEYYNYMKEIAACLESLAE